MKKFTKILISVLCAAFLAIPVFCVACNTQKPEEEDEFIDYVSNLSLDFTNGTKKQEVTVRLFVDGDTTHFDPVTNSELTPYNAADFADTLGYIKARYLAINTPESTGKIEEWGKTASNFTHDALEKAESIIVESDDGNWNVDSTGSRYLLWVWYKPEGGTEYRNLNVEILQKGLALGSSVANNRYGEIASAALNQAKANKLYVFSDDKDPLFDYNVATEVTLKELRCNVTDYLQKNVRVEGVVAAEFGNTVYIEDYDAETGVYFGMAVYYGYTSGDILDILSVGNKVSVMGSVTEFQGTYQISGVSYSAYNPTALTNTYIVDTENKYSAAFDLTTANDIINGTLEYYAEELDEDGEEQTVKKEIAYGDAIMASTVTVEHLTVTRVYTTASGASAGAMSLTCEAADGTQITVRTEVLKDSNGDLITAAQFNGKEITVKGIIEKYQGAFQVKVYRADFIEILD